MSILFTLTARRPFLRQVAGLTAVGTPALQRAAENTNNPPMPVIDCQVHVGTPNDFTTRYDPATIPLPQNFLAEHPFDHGNLRGRDELLLPWPRTPELVSTGESQSQTMTLSARIATATIGGVCEIGHSLVSAMHSVRRCQHSLVLIDE